MRKLKLIINNTDINILSILPVLLAIITLVFGCRVLGKYAVQCNDFGLGIVGILSLGISSLTGYIQIYRREAPGIHLKYPFTGRLAVIIGLVWVAMCVGGMIYIIYNLIMQ